MIVYEVKKKKSKETNMDTGVNFFGPEELGMELTFSEPCCLAFFGASGFANAYNLPWNCKAGNEIVRKKGVNL